MADSSHADVDTLQRFAAKLAGIVDGFDRAAQQAVHGSRLDDGKLGELAASPLLAGAYRTMSNRLHLLLNDTVAQIQNLRGNTARVTHRYRQTDADNRVPFVESQAELPKIHASQYQPQPGQCTVQESELLNASQQQVEQERSYAEAQERQLHE
ncbi:hypothetical protein TH66_14930 [Carbonactinospora thermoautotrophica]|uniref:Uncharacterized protein n=1 Tax=Carbonactinospora thermoautotrophica TaxID=1469144 RepID=A0A132MVI3_9ACTN|nr:hypothetical protein [Carbonactinospora thermoautotrophica]KWX00185.1 hypothetical protein TH66_14930 [Carbonactinospora thermoautotrophica]KWX01814.1 hypothetical protein LI90_2846 [Carbonactinospora thermoautotrophica]KWX09013.1 hypothetical protein TR74_12190 [Carbonactinospora thermoautotrophica]